MSRARVMKPRRALVVSAVAALALAAVAAHGAPPPSPGASALAPAADTVREAAPRTLLVIGDSYSSYYGDLSTPYPGWWAFVAEHLALEPTVLAEAGTGFLATGMDCARTPFLAHNDELRGADPTVLIVEGGRNDYRRCTPDGRIVEATRTEIVAAVGAYFADLSATWQAMGRAPGDVYVVSPWGSELPRKAGIVRSIVRDAATRHGFVWVPTGRLDLQHAPDGTHPNEAGSHQLARQVLGRSDLAARFVPAGT